MAASVLEYVHVQKPLPLRHSCYHLFKRNFPGIPNDDSDSNQHCIWYMPFCFKIGLKLCTKVFLEHKIKKYFEQKKKFIALPRIFKSQLIYQTSVDLNQKLGHKEDKWCQ